MPLFIVMMSNNRSFLTVLLAALNGDVYGESNCLGQIVMAKIVILNNKLTENILTIYSAIECNSMKRQRAFNECHSAMAGQQKRFTQLVNHK